MNKYLSSREPFNDVGERPEGCGSRWRGYGKIHFGEECQDTSRSELNYICNSKAQVMHRMLEQTAGRLALAKKGVMFVDEIFWCSL